MHISSHYLEKILNPTRKQFAAVHITVDPILKNFAKKLVDYFNFCLFQFVIECF